MWKDEVLEEIYRIREEHAKAFNYNRPLAKVSRRSSVHSCKDRQLS